MGILKHAVLPALTLHHIYVCISVLLQGKQAYLTFLDLPLPDQLQHQRQPPVQGYNDIVINRLEAHFIGIIVGAHIMCIINNVMSIVQEDSHYRGMAVMMQQVWFVIQWCDAYTMGGWQQQITAIFAAICIIGLLIHTNEPGIFTKDKNKQS